MQRGHKGGFCSNGENVGREKGPGPTAQGVQGAEMLEVRLGHCTEQNSEEVKKKWKKGHIESNRTHCINGTKTAAARDD